MNVTKYLKHWPFWFYATILIFTGSYFWFVSLYGLWVSAASLLFSAIASQFATFIANCIGELACNIKGDTDEEKEIEEIVKGHFARLADGAAHCINSYLSQYVAIWNTVVLTLGALAIFFWTVKYNSTLFPSGYKYDFYCKVLSGFLFIGLITLFIQAIRKPLGTIFQYKGNPKGLVLPLNLLTILRGLFFMLFTISTIFLELSSRPK